MVRICSPTGGENKGKQDLMIKSNFSIKCNLWSVVNLKQLTAAGSILLVKDVNNVTLPVLNLSCCNQVLSLFGMFFNPSSVLSQRPERYQEGFRPVTGQDHLNQSSYCSNSSFILRISTSLSVKQHKSVSPCFLSLAFVLHKCAPGLGERGQDFLQWCYVTDLSFW